MPEHNHPIERFPHLLEEDAKVWRRYLAAHGSQFESFTYDIRVGDGRDPGPGFETNIRNMGIRLSQRRIDAAGFNGNKVTLFEITRRAGLTAIGQLKTYPILWKRMFPDTDLQGIILIAESIQDDIEPTLIADNLQFLLFPEPAK